MLKTKHPQRRILAKEFFKNQSVYIANMMSIGLVFAGVFLFIVFRKLRTLAAEIGDGAGGLTAVVESFLHQISLIEILTLSYLALTALLMFWLSVFLSKRVYGPVVAISNALEQLRTDEKGFRPVLLRQNDDPRMMDLAAKVNLLAEKIRGPSRPA